MSNSRDLLVTASVRVSSPEEARSLVWQLKEFLNARAPGGDVQTTVIVLSPSRPEPTPDDLVADNNRIIPPPVHPGFGVHIQ
jgi:hypothetical protein